MLLNRYSLTRLILCLLHESCVVQLERVDCEQHARACDVAGQVDAGYALFTVLPAEPMQQRPIVLLVGRTAFPAPWWIARNGSTEADLIAADWHTPHCHSPYLRTKFINWCVAQLNEVWLHCMPLMFLLISLSCESDLGLSRVTREGRWGDARWGMCEACARMCRHAHRMFRQLRVLDYFDFWVKVDDDARWAGKFPGDITHHLVSKRRIFFHMGGFLQASLPTERCQSCPTTSTTVSVICCWMRPFAPAIAAACHRFSPGNEVLRRACAPPLHAVEVEESLMEKLCCWRGRLARDGRGGAGLHRAVAAGRLQAGDLLPGH